MANGPSWYGQYLFNSAFKTPGRPDRRGRSARPGTASRRRPPATSAAASGWCPRTARTSKASTALAEWLTTSDENLDGRADLPGVRPRREGLAGEPGEQRDYFANDISEAFTDRGRRGVDRLVEHQVQRRDARGRAWSCRPSPRARPSPRRCPPGRRPSPTRPSRSDTRSPRMTALDAERAPSLVDATPGSPPRGSAAAGRLARVPLRLRLHRPAAGVRRLPDAVRGVSRLHQRPRPVHRPRPVRQGGPGLPVRAGVPEHRDLPGDVAGARRRAHGRGGGDPARLGCGPGCPRCSASSTTSPARWPASPACWSGCSCSTRRSAPSPGCSARSASTRSPRCSRPSNLPVIFVLIAFWTGAGGWIVVMYGALNNIPDEVLEAARIDGAGSVADGLAHPDPDDPQVDRLHGDPRLRRRHPALRRASAAADREPRPGQPDLVAEPARLRLRVPARRLQRRGRDLALPAGPRSDLRAASW